MSSSSLVSLKDKIAIVTGGSSGIGKATVESLLKENAIVVNADIAEPESTITDSNNRSFFCRTDVRNVEQVQQLYNFVAEKVGVPQILICNAGKGIHEKISEGDPEKWSNVININLIGTLRILRSFLPALLSTKNADIIFISSVASKNAYEYGGIYAATKAAIDVIAETLRLEIKDAGRITVISPGVVETSFFKNLESGYLDVESIGVDALHPANVANAVLFALTRNKEEVINNITLRPIRQSF